MSGRPLRRAREAMRANGGVVPLDKRSIERFVDDVLMPQVVMALRRLPPDSLVGDGETFASAPFLVKGDGESVHVEVWVESRGLRNSMSVTSGGYLRHHPAPAKVACFLNAMLTPFQLLALAGERAGSENNGAALAPAIYSVLIHEFTHVMDYRYPQRTGYKSDGTNISIGRVAYINTAVEARAFTQQTVHECVAVARLHEVREIAASRASPNRALVDECLERSRTWWLNAQFFNDVNLKRLIAAILRALDQEGLLFP